MKRTKFAIESEKYAKENPFVETKGPKFFPTDWKTSCDHCQHQEGRHYCLLHGVTVKNMDMMACRDWQNRDEKDNVIKALQANITEIMANKAELARENEELRKALKEAFYLIENIGWTSVEQPEVISRAEKWLQSFSAL